MKHFLKKSIKLKEKAPYSRTFLNLKETTYYKLIRYYRALYDFIQEKYFLASCDFSNEENTVLMDSIYFGKEFPKPRWGNDNKKADDKDDQDNEQNPKNESEWRSVSISAMGSNSLGSQRNHGRERNL